MEALDSTSITGGSGFLESGEKPGTCSLPSLGIANGTVVVVDRRKLHSAETMSAKPDGKPVRLTRTGSHRLPVSAATLSRWQVCRSSSLRCVSGNALGKKRHFLFRER